LGPIRGFLAPFRGAAYVARHRLWAYLVAPLLMNTGLAVGSTATALWLVRDRVGAQASPLLTLGLWVAALVLGLLLFVAAQPLVCAPFIDLLTERVERIERGGHPQRGFFLGVLEALWHGLLKALCYVVALTAIWFLAPTGVGAILGLGMYAVSLAFDGFDYPLARRGEGFGGKWRYLALHPGQTLGYCLGAGLLYLVPLAILVAPAFAAVGATLAYLDTAPADHDSTGDPARRGHNERMEISA